jgi:hypothetical protein
VSASVLVIEAVVVNMSAASVRDLVAEAKKLTEAATLKAEQSHMAPTPKTKASKKDTELPDAMTTAEIQDKVAESWHCSLDSSFFVMCSEESQDEIVNMADTDAAECMQAIKTTVYFNTGFVMNHSPVWKSAECAPVIGSPLFWFVCHEMEHSKKLGNNKSWYCATHLFGTSDEQAALEKEAGLTFRVVAWARGDQELPLHVHLPCWRAKATKGIDVVPLWDQYLNMMAVAGQQNAELVDTSAKLEEHTNEIENLKTQLQELTESNLHMAQCLGNLIEDKELTDEEQAKCRIIVKGTLEASGEWQSNRASGSGSQTHAPKNRGGWLPKMAPLGAAIYHDDLKLAKQLMDKYWDESPTLQGLIQNILNKKSGYGWHAK